MSPDWDACAMTQHTEGYIGNARNMWATLGRVVLDRDGVFASCIPGETHVICSGSNLTVLPSVVENEHDRRIVVENIYEFGYMTPELTQMVMPLMYAPATGSGLRSEGARIHRVSTVAELQAAEAMIVSSFPFSHLSGYEAGQILDPNLLDSSALSIWTMGAAAVPDAACLSFSEGPLVGLYWLTTKPTSRRAGVATALVSSLRTHFADNALVLVSTPAAETLYEHNGFRRVRDVRWLFGSR